MCGGHRPLRGLRARPGSGLVAPPRAPGGAWAFTTVSVTVTICAAVDEFLDATTADRFARVQISLRVDRHHVQEGEVSGHMPGPPEPGEDRAPGPEQRAPEVHDPRALLPAHRLL